VLACNTVWVRRGQLMRSKRRQRVPRRISKIRSFSKQKPRLKGWEVRCKDVAVFLRSLGPPWSSKALPKGTTACEET